MHRLRIYTRERLKLMWLNWAPALDPHLRPAFLNRFARLAMKLIDVLEENVNPLFNVYVLIVDK